MEHVRIKTDKRELDGETHNDISKITRFECEDNTVAFVNRMKQEVHIAEKPHIGFRKEELIELEMLN